MDSKSNFSRNLDPEILFLIANNMICLKLFVDRLETFG